MGARAENGSSQRVANATWVYLILAASAPALAAPPGAAHPAGPYHPTVLSAASAPLPRPGGSRLDLEWNLGPDSAPGSDAASGLASAPAPFGRAAFRPRTGIDLQGPDYREWLPALGRDAAPVEPSRIEAMARRLHHEGLPLARLWQNDSALLSLGLNPRGKPGLWLIQKLH